MKVIVTGDFHGFLPEVDPCDLLLIMGDICPDSRQESWLRKEFSAWLKQVEARSIVAIAGNHDIVAVQKALLLRSLDWIYLCDEETTVQGLKIYGTPWSLTFGAFATDEEHLRRLWSWIPDDTDILLTHTPAHGRGDYTAFDEHIGSTTLRERVDGLQNLKLHAFGHAHEAYGQGALPNGGSWINGSHLGEGWQPFNPPVVIAL